MKKNIPLLLALTLFFSFCGKKGPLVLEPEKLPRAVMDLHIRQIGNQVELQWKFPTLLSDKKTPFELARCSRIFIYHSDKPVADEKFHSKAELLAKPKMDKVTSLGDGTFSFILTFKTKMLKESEHAFALFYSYGRKKSAAGPVRKLKTYTPPQAIQDLKLSQERKVVMLLWSRPQKDSDGQALAAIAGYTIYRRIDVGNKRDVFKAINTAIVPGENYQDQDTGTDGEYVYQVACRLGDRVESAPSNQVKIKVQDTFPPDIPGNMVIFTAKDQIFLTWEAVPDVDLAFYRVYRKFSEKEEFKLLVDSVTDNFFRDKQVASGKLYIYAISAVDKKGNESELSGSVQQLF